MIRLLSCRCARWARASGLLAAVLLACNAPQEPQTSVYDAYYRGTWELISIIDNALDTVIPRSPTAQEARTWHVFSSEEYLADTVRAPVTVEWAGSSGSGYWYFCCSTTVRMQATLTRPGGGTEVYAADLLWGGSDGTTLDLTDNHGYIETYRKVGGP
jgi:hypothetical protein